MERGNQTASTDAPLPQGKMPEPSAPASGTDTVTVACKVPNGIIFDLYEMQKDYEPLLGGGQKEIMKAYALGIRVSLRGPAPDFQAMRRGQATENPLAGGFALTTGVPRDHWEKIERDYKDHPALVNGLVFGCKNDISAIDEARNRGALETGLEGIDPDNPAKRTGLRAVSRATPAAAA